MTSHIEQIARQEGVSPDQVRATILKLRNDSAYWIEKVLGKKLWAKQREICRAWDDPRLQFVRVPTANGVGKSFTGGSLVLHALNNVYPLMVITTAPTERQVVEILWKEIRSLHRQALTPLAGTPDMKQLKISEDQRAIGFATGEYDQNLFQGIRDHNTRLVLDEACGITPVVYEGSLSIMASGNSKMIEFSNPVDRSSEFYKGCTSSDKDSVTISVSAWETPNFTIPGYELTEYNFICAEDSPDWWETKLGPYVDPKKLPTPYLTLPKFVHNVIRRYGVTSAQYVTRVCGRFADQSEESLFGYGEIDDAMRYTPPEGTVLGPLELGVDVARKGDNQTVVYGWMDPILRRIDSWSKADTDESAKRIIEIAKRCARHGHPPTQVKVDVIGVGGGVVDILRHTTIDLGRGPQSFPVVAFNGASREGLDRLQSEIRFENHRAYAYWLAKKRLEARTVDLPKLGYAEAEPLRQQLLSIRKVDRDATDKMCLEGKIAMRSRGVDSPDDADAAIIAMYQGPRVRGDHGVTI